MADQKQAYEGNATRSVMKERMDLISPHGLHALGRRLALGAERHGERNWETGGESFRQATVGHLIAHATSYMENPNQEDTDALICNAMFLCHFEAKKLVEPPAYEHPVEAPRVNCPEVHKGAQCWGTAGHKGPHVNPAAQLTWEVVESDGNPPARCPAVGQEGQCSDVLGHTGHHINIPSGYTWGEPCQTVSSIQQRDRLAGILTEAAKLELCLEKMEGNHTCVRKKGHDGQHARYGIGS